MNLSLNAATTPDDRLGSSSAQPVNLSSNGENAPSTTAAESWSLQATALPHTSSFLSSPPVDDRMHKSEKLGLKQDEQGTSGRGDTETHQARHPVASTAAPVGLAPATESGVPVIVTPEDRALQYANFIQRVEAGLIEASTLETMVRAGSVSTVDTPEVVAAMQHFYSEQHSRLTSQTAIKTRTSVSSNFGSDL